MGTTSLRQWDRIVDGYDATSATNIESLLTSLSTAAAADDTTGIETAVDQLRAEFSAVGW